MAVLPSGWPDGRAGQRGYGRAGDPGNVPGRSPAAGRGGRVGRAARRREAARRRARRCRASGCECAGDGAPGTKHGAGHEIRVRRARDHGAPGTVRGRSRTAPGDRCQRAHPRSVDRRALPVTPEAVTDPHPAHTRDTYGVCRQFTARAPEFMTLAGQRWCHAGIAADADPGRRPRGGGPGHHRPTRARAPERGGPPAPAGPPLFAAVFWRQFAGGRTVMAMVPVKISSLMRKTIAVR